MPTTTAEPLFERERELAQFGERLEAARAGRGGLVVIEGSPGIGKTRVLGTMRERAERDGMRALDARGSDLERDLAFGVVRQLFERALQQAAVDEREALLDGPARFSASALGIAGMGAEAGPDRSYAVLHGLYWLASNLAEKRPLLLCVDDAHWSDPPSLRFLHYLSRRVADLPVLVAVTVRTGDPESEAELVARIREEPAVAVLRPEPLTAAAVADLVRDGLGDAAPEFSDACHRATGGNPFLVGELISSLATDGIEPSASEAAGVAQLVPDAIGRHVFARLARLPTAALRLARAVAVLGGEAEGEPAAALAGLEMPDAAGAAEGLAKAELVEGGERLRFVHPLIREAVYSDLPRAERAAAHRRAARLLADAGATPDRIAAQLVATEPAGETWAAEALQRAAREALARGAPDSAAQLLRRAVEEGPDGAGDGLLLELAGAELLAGSAEAAIGRLERLLDADGGSPGLATVAPLLHVARWGAGRFEAAVEIADRGAPELAASDPGAALLLELSAAMAVVERESFEAAAPRLQAIRGDDAERSEPSRLLAGTLVELAGLSAAERPIRLAEAAAARFGGISPPLGLQTFAYLIVALHALERYDTALGLIDAAIARARAMGDVSTLLIGLCWRAWNAHRRGALEDSRTAAELALAVTDDAELHMLDPTAAAILMSVATEVDPEGELARWGDLPFEPRGDASDYGVFAFRGILRLAQGRLPAARADLAAAAEGWDRMGLPGLSAADVRPSLALAHRALGEAERAEEIARESLDRAERVGTPRLRGLALRCLALVGARDRRVELLSESVAALEGSPARLDRAHALCDLGAALRREGARKDCREPLGRARELAHACGATALERRAHEELLASGGRPRRISASGADALTPSERRVAGLAADGHSNREIAQELFLSLKTVEMHLSRSYRKLDIRSREELPRALQAGAGGEDA